MNYRGSEKEDETKRCSIPDCHVVEPGVGELTCVIWGNRRLCFSHFYAFAAHPLSVACEEKHKGPSDSEWEAFIGGVKARAA